MASVGRLAEFTAGSGRFRFLQPGKLLAAICRNDPGGSAAAIDSQPAAHAVGRRIRVFLDAGPDCYALDVYPPRSSRFALAHRASE